MKKDIKLISELKNLLNEKFDNLIEKIYCYGSRITENKQETDFDIIIITKKGIDWCLEDKIDSEIIRFGIENDILFDAQIFSAEKFLRYSYIPYLSNAIKLGVVL
ncbi:MAG: hypothetical protein N3A61_06745 [Ignavibacteria bacterium]|nr:hypothetical protein [Ignavibacteria bacterium]